MSNLKISQLIQRTPNGEEYFEVIIPPFTAGTNRKVLLSDIFDQLGGYRGDWDSTGDVLPTGATVLAGYKWRLTADYKGIGSGSTIEAAIDGPATDSDWNFYVTSLL